MYKISELTGLTYTNENVLVPQDDNNQIWQDWHQWKLNGNVEQSFIGTDGEIAKDLRNKCVQQITPKQLEQQLFLQGISSDDVVNAINQLSDPTKTLGLIAWKRAIAFDRQDSTLIAISQMLGLTEQQTNDLFNNASLL